MQRGRSAARRRAWQGAGETPTKGRRQLKHELVKNLRIGNTLARVYQSKSKATARRELRYHTRREASHARAAARRTARRLALDGAGVHGQGLAASRALHQEGDHLHLRARKGRRASQYPDSG